MTTIRTSPKKARTPQAKTQALWDAIGAVAEDYERMSVRQLYYQLVSRGVIEKTEAAYKRVCDASAQMRLDGRLPYQKIADGHRTRRGVFAHGGLGEALETAHDLYRRNYWIDQPCYVEVWSEKDALTGVIQPVCQRYGVTYVATRGFPSITLRYESAIALMKIGKPTAVLYFGDHDASGQKISDNLEAELRHHGANVWVRRIALNPDHVRRYALPTRPGKQSDSRQAAFTKRFGDASVELDALPPDALTDLVETSIWEYIEPEQWRQSMDVEALERKTLASITELGWRMEPGKTYSLGEETA
ncbi:MAG TPA: hypothetical protein VGR16_05300 [Thermomicrobiales bacterium]|nr:hypothetical protein [Thermomicrobiales bacterium]